MATVFIDGIGAQYGLPGGNLTTTVFEFDVSKYYEVRGFFARKAESEEITITLQVVRPNDPNEPPATGGGTVIGTLDTFALPDEAQPITRSYTTPGLWLQVLATTGPHSARLHELSFIGRE
jgi:hypothetical protein